MGVIRKLSTEVVNQIAAGEVVERPASVVKELLENAIDAGATRIEVAVERGGKDLVRVADDGSGMERDDLLLAFQPHATSKLKDADDLCRIATLGFRGEALAAIAQVSKVRCQTKMAQAPVGSELAIEAGVASPIRDCGCAPGTAIEVRNLFYNIPVRRTFLKSDPTEAGHVAEMFIRVALAHPTVHLTFRSGGRVVHDLPAGTGLKERIAVFFGRELADSLLWVESQLESTHVWGYVAHPSQSRPSAKGQYLFVGRRYVRDRSLGHALTEAYRGLLMVGRMPVAFLHLEIPPEEVDVNVHPTKIEVRFRDGQRVYGQLLSTVRQTFLTSDLHAQLQAPPVSQPEPASQAREPRPYELVEPPLDRQAIASWFSAGRTAGSQSSTVEAVPSSPPAGFVGRSAPPAWSRSLPPVARPEPAELFDEFSASAPVREPSGRASPRLPTPDALALSATDPSPPQLLTAEPVEDVPPRALQVHDSYLVVETKDGMVVIDQHALHERILYEEMRERVERGGVEAQRLLVPQPVDLTAAEAAAVLERRDVLSRLGLEVEPFGGDTVLVSSTPAMLASAPPERLLRDLADHLRSSPLPPTADAVLEDILNMMACKAAIKAGQRLSPEEVAALLEKRHLVSNTHHCPHGRPTALVFTKAELERQFGRI